MGGDLNIIQSQNDAETVNGKSFADIQADAQGRVDTHAISGIHAITPHVGDLIIGGSGVWEALAIAADGDILTLVTGSPQWVTPAITYDSNGNITIGLSLPSGKNTVFYTDSGIFRFGVGDYKGQSGIGVGNNYPVGYWNQGNTEFLNCLVMDANNNLQVGIGVPVGSYTGFYSDNGSFRFGIGTYKGQAGLGTSNNYPLGWWNAANTAFINALVVDANNNLQIGIGLPIGAYSAFYSDGGVFRFGIGTSQGQAGIGVCNNYPMGWWNSTDTAFIEAIRVDASGLLKIGAGLATGQLYMNIDGALKLVSLGAADSGGTGYKYLRVPNS